MRRADPAAAECCRRRDHQYAVARAKVVRKRTHRRALETGTGISYSALQCPSSSTTSSTFSMGPKGKFGYNRTALADRMVEPAMASRIDHVSAAAQYRDGATTSLQRCRVGGAVNTVSQTADDAYTPLDETVRQFAGDLHTVFRGFAQSDNSHGWPR